MGEFPIPEGATVVQSGVVLAFVVLQITLFSDSIELCDYVRSNDSRKRQEVFRNQKGNLLSTGKAYQSCALWMGSEFSENCYQTTSLLGKMGSGHKGSHNLYISGTKLLIYVLNLLVIW